MAVSIGDGEWRMFRVDFLLSTAKMIRHTSKAALTRARNAMNYLMNAEQPQEEVSQSLLLYKQTYETLVLKHEEYASLIENDEVFTVEEHWLEECQETFMNLEMKAKLYIESKVVEIVDVELAHTIVEAGTSVRNLGQQMHRQSSMQKSDGIPTDAPLAAQATNPISCVDQSTTADHANEQSEQNMNQTCSFKIEKPKMPKFSGDVLEYAIFSIVERFD